MHGMRSSRVSISDSQHAHVVSTVFGASYKNKRSRKIRGRDAADNDDERGLGSWVYLFTGGVGLVGGYLENGWRELVVSIFRMGGVGGVQLVYALGYVENLL
jgi:hypothetical protein